MSPDFAIPTGRNLERKIQRSAKSPNFTIPVERWLEYRKSITEAGDWAAVEWAGLFQRGILVAGTLTSAQTIRVEPPLIVSYEQMDIFLERLEDTLKSVSRSL
jgi:adenosylmethionine-8-amino-7-oxononanoate aminotransferase